MTETKNAATTGNKANKNNAADKNKTPVKKPGKTKNKSTTITPENISQQALNELNKAILKSMQEAQDAVAQAVHKMSKQSDYSEEDYTE